MRLHTNSKDKRTITFYNGLEKRLNTLYNHKYDYSNTVYTTKRKDIEYICPKHGTVKQQAGEHVRGRGCKQCAIEYTALQSRLTTSKVIKQFKEKHSNMYDYSKVKYINDTIDVLIICPKHGEFNQNPGKHKKGVKCPQCRIDERSMTNSKFLKEAGKHHNNKYIYQNVPELVKYSTAIEYICNKHGIQTQKAGNHLKFNGCLLCQQRTKRWSKAFYRNKITTLYYIRIGNLYKIGVTTRSINKRFETEPGIRKQIEEIQIWEFKNGAIAFDIEQECLKATKKVVNKDKTI